MACAPPIGRWLRLAFCIGAVAAGWLGRRAAELWPLLGAEALLLAAAAALPGPNSVRVAITATAMGVQSVQAVRLGVPGVTTTVVTGTLASLFAHVADEPRRQHGPGLLGLVWLLYVTGAVVGALCAYLWSFAIVCWFAAALACAAAAIAHRASKTPGG